MKKIITPFVLLFCIFLFSQCKKQIEVVNTPLTVQDADGNVYQTVEIGNQVWMSENLKTTKFNDGTPITKYEFRMDWLNLNTPQALYQWAGTIDLNNVNPTPLPFDYYGAMYNHTAIESGKLAPIGWRVPTEQDFLVLKNHLANNGFAGKEALALKTNFGWAANSGNGIDAVGFRGLPNGYVSAFGGPVNPRGICNWATTTTNSSGRTRRMVTLVDKDTMSILNNPYHIGAGIRCIKE